MMNSNRERKRILLVEDEEDAQELVTLTLAEYTLICAHNFDEGLLAAQRGYFDLYILDNWLPGGSGVELCRHIRKFDPHTPILFYSAAAYARDIREATRAGAQSYLVKPVIPDELKLMAARLTFATREAAFEARRAESAAILEELAIRQAEKAERVESAKENYLRAEERHLRAKEKALRAKALCAFIAAGGTRGDFAREWPSMLLEEVRGQRKSDSASSH
jgi:DNA-binding response OmpR family regulator